MQKNIFVSMDAGNIYPLQSCDEAHMYTNPKAQTNPLRSTVTSEFP